ncbi:MAG: DUF4199 domain-containing protein [Ignavibacteriaceae bacterium]|nr:DUF4199 domain-containing protein [Ignavibacteriaceae bacterium]
MQKIKTELKWALIFVGMTLAWMVLEKVTGMTSTNIDKHYIFTNFIAIPAIAVYVFALLDKKKTDFGGNMSYKQGFISGLIITAIVTILSPLTQYITSVIIVPEYFPNIIRHSVATGLMKQADAEAYFNLQSYIIQGLIGAPIMGLITTAIVAIFTRSKSKG